MTPTEERRSVLTPAFTHLLTLRDQLAELQRGVAASQGAERRQFEVELTWAENSIALTLAEARRLALAVEYQNS